MKRSGLWELGRSGGDASERDAQVGRSRFPLRAELLPALEQAVVDLPGGGRLARELAQARLGFLRSAIRSLQPGEPLTDREHLIACDPHFVLQATDRQVHLVRELAANFLQLFRQPQCLWMLLAQRGRDDLGSGLLSGT
jgi:hypothetical protein